MPIIFIIFYFFISNFMVRDHKLGLSKRTRVLKHASQVTGYEKHIVKEGSPTLTMAKEGNGKKHL